MAPLPNSNKAPFAMSQAQATVDPCIHVKLHSYVPEMENTRNNDELAAR